MFELKLTASESDILTWALRGQVARLPLKPEAEPINAILQRWIVELEAKAAEERGALMLRTVPKGNP